MPDCPINRTCSWIVKNQEVHHDWWTTSAATWLLAFVAVLMLLGWAIFQRERSQRHQVSTEEYTAVSLAQQHTLPETQPAQTPSIDDTQQWPPSV